jgi:DNA polymerase III sliding clamp (beta) subunit (PCNA family)
MLTDLKFVQGAVSTKDFIPAMSHFQLANGTIRSFNGNLTISSPIDCHLVCNPKADNLIRAISNCGQNTTLTLTAKGRLSIKSGVFKAIVDCHPEPLPVLDPTGSFYAIDGETVYKALSDLYPVIGEDASRPWANGILLYGNKLVATNNVVIVQKQIGSAFPMPLNIPKQAVKELLRVREYPSYIQTDGNHLTFHYAKDRWIRTTLFDLGWPDIDKVLPVNLSNCKPVPDGFFKALESLKPFSDDMGRVHISENYLSTYPITEPDETGAAIEVEGLVIGEGIFQIEMLLKLKSFCCAFDCIEKGMLFAGDNLRGIAMGLRR